MNLNFSSETFQIIESVIKDEFDRRFDRNPLGDKLQAKLTDAFRLANYRLMSLSLEEAGDYFSANTDAVQESVRLYQDAIFCLSHDPSEKELGKLLAGLDFDHKRFETSNSEYIVPDLFNPVQLSLQQNSIDNDLAVRLLFKAGTGMLLQSQHKRAEDFFSKALQIDRVRPSSDCLYRPCILSNLAIIMRYNESSPTAVQYLQEALDIFERLNRKWEKGKVLSMLAGIESSLNDLSKAEKLYLEALELYESSDFLDKRGVARANNGLGILYLQKKEFERAFQYFETAYKNAKDLNIAELIWPINWGLGCCYLAKHEYEKAEKHLDASIRYIEHFQDNLYTDEGKATFIEGVQFVYEKMFEVLIGAHEKYKNRLSDLLKLMERTRGQALSDLFGDQLEMELPEELLDESFDEKGGYEASFSGMHYIAQGNPRGLNYQLERVPQSEVKRRVFGNKKLQHRIFSSPRRLIFKILPSQTIILLVDEMDIPITMEVLQKGEKEWENDMNRFRSIIGRNRFKLRKISFNFEETVNSTPSQFSKSFFEKLYIEVLQPFIEHLPPEGELLLVEPDGPLWQLPLHLILFPDGRYAGDIWPITYTPSFEVYKNIKSKPYLPIHPEDWFFFGGLGQLHSHTGIEFDPLPFAEDEVDIISKEILQIPSKYVFTGNACTVETGHLFIPGSRIVHLATHGEARSDNPLDSFVVLLGGMLTAEDVRNLMLPHCELVTLSACKSGLGKIMSEGMVGLARAFMLAGARSLLVSLWSVEDESTKLIMEEFYKELIANGGHKAKALQAAMNSVRKMPGMQNPESWAPFVLIGIEDCEHNFKTTPT